MSEWSPLTLSNACEGELESLFQEALTEARMAFCEDVYIQDGGKLRFGVNLKIDLVHNVETGSVAVEASCVTKPPKRRPRVGSATLKGSNIWNPPGIQQSLLDARRPRPSAVNDPQE